MKRPATKLRLAVDNTGCVEGYASLFGVPDLTGDIVMPGAFHKSLQKRGSRGVRMLWQHNPAEPVGLWESLEEDHVGLKVKGYLIQDVKRAKELSALIEKGALDGLSIGFRTLRAERIKGARHRKLYAVDLWEVSLVTFPMLPGARLSRHIKSQTDFEYPAPGCAAGSTAMRENPMAASCAPVNARLESAAKRLRQHLIQTTR